MKKALDPEALREVLDDWPSSQRALARAALCSPNVPSRLLAGKTTSDDTAARLARILGKRPDELFVDAVSSTEPDLSKQEAAA